MKLAETIGADKYLIKPAPIEAVLDALREVMATQAARLVLPLLVSPVDFPIRDWKILGAGKSEKELPQHKQLNGSKSSTKSLRTRPN